MENQAQHSLFALRAIADHITAVGGVRKVQISKDLASARAARSCYQAYLDAERQKAAATARASKRKASAAELEELAAKQKRISASLILC